MLRGNAPARHGWVLVDVLCCVIVVTIVVTCVAQTTDMMADIALKNRDMRAKAADYLSLSDEMSVRSMTADTREYVYGKWKGEKIKSGSLKGLEFSDVALKNESAGENWGVERLWNIAGRR